MTKRSAHHATFVIERSYAAPPARVFAAWADAKAKARWFVGPDEWEKSDHKLDFRVGGKESVSGGPPLEFKPAGSDTKLVLTEQNVFLDGFDNVASRDKGTRDLLDNLESWLR